MVGEDQFNISRPGQSEPMPTTITPVIRQGLPGDAENLTALALQVWLHTYATDGVSSVISRFVLSEFTVQAFEVLLNNANTSIFVAEVNGHLVGYARVDADAPCPPPGSSTVRLVTLYVQAHFAGRGVGSALLARAKLMAEEGGQPLWLTVNAMNKRAIAFYGKHGYRKIGITQFVLGGREHENHVLVGCAA